jgi:hypothetical protein
VLKRLATKGVQKHEKTSFEFRMGRDSPVDNQGKFENSNKCGRSVETIQEQSIKPIFALMRKESGGSKVKDGNQDLQREKE